MKFLIDQNAPVSLAEALRQAGHDAIHTRELDLARATDAELMELARVEQRVVVTYDGDFAQMLALTGAGSPSVLYLRGTVLPNHAARVVLGSLDRIQASLRDGAIVSLRGAETIRVRRLPIK